jgi:hypothetical protein
MLKDERLSHPSYKKEIHAYLDLVQMKHIQDHPTDSKEKKSVHFTEKKASSQGKSGERSSRPNNRSEVREGDIPYCINHSKFKSHWTWDCDITLREIAASEAASKAAGGKKTWLKRSSQSTTSNKSDVKGCDFCDADSRLRANCLNHLTKECKWDPNSKSFKGKSTNLHIKSALREVLNEPADKKRSRSSKDKPESGEDPNDSGTNSKRSRQEEEVAEETSDSSEESEHAASSAEHD